MENLDKIVNLCKGRGFIFQGSEIYGGMGNTSDYGPIGVELKNNIKKAWWKKFVQQSENSFGVDAAILMNSRVWDASGHTASFSDPKMDCKNLKVKIKQKLNASKLSKKSVNNKIEQATDENATVKLNEKKTKKQNEKVDD